MKICCNRTCISNNKYKGQKRRSTTPPRTCPRLLLYTASTTKKAQASCNLNKLCTVHLMHTTLITITTRGIFSTIWSRKTNITWNSCLRRTGTWKKRLIGSVEFTPNSTRTSTKSGGPDSGSPASTAKKTTATRKSTCSFSESALPSIDLFLSSF